MHLEGSIPALITPMQKNAAIDFDAWNVYTKMHNKQRSSGLVILGSTAEAMLLDNTEREKILEIARNNISTMPLITGVCAHDYASAKEKIDQAHYYQANAILLSAPYYLRPCQNGIKAYFTALSDYAKVPVILYCVPSRVGVAVSNETIKACATHENIIGIKDANTKREDLKTLIQSLPKDFSYLSGDDDSFLDLINKGGQGVVSVGANILPNVFQNMVSEQIKRPKENNSSAEYAETLLEVLRLGPNPAMIKYIVSELLGMNYTMRAPLEKINDTLQKKVHAKLTKRYQKDVQQLQDFA